jgi:hypothetical protein
MIRFDDIVQIFDSGSGQFRASSKSLQQSLQSYTAPETVSASGAFLIRISFTAVYILQQRLVQRQFGHQLLEPRVFIAKLLQLSNLLHLQSNVLCLPSVARLLADAHLTD